MGVYNNSRAIFASGPCKLTEDVHHAGYENGTVSCYTCPTAAGAGKDFHWRLCINGLCGYPSTQTTRYTRPTVTGFAGQGVDSSTQGGDRITIEGESSISMVKRRLLLPAMISGFNFGPVTEFIDYVESSSKEGNKVFVPSNCTLIDPHTAISCYTEPGFGDGLKWRVEVADQTSDHPVTYAQPPELLEFITDNLARSVATGGSFPSDAPQLSSLCAEEGLSDMNITSSCFNEPLYLEETKHQPADPTNLNSTGNELIVIRGSQLGLPGQNCFVPTEDCEDPWSAQGIALYYGPDHDAKRYRARSCRYGRRQGHEEVWCLTARGLGGPYRVTYRLLGHEVRSNLAVTYRSSVTESISPSHAPTESAKDLTVYLEGENLGYPGISTSQVRSTASPSSTLPALTL